MDHYSIRNFIPEDVSSIYNIQAAYNKAYPEASVIPGEAYLSPEFNNGNMFCLLNEKREIVGYLPFSLLWQKTAATGQRMYYG